VSGKTESYTLDTNQNDVPLIAMNLAFLTKQQVDDLNFDAAQIQLSQNRSSDQTLH